MKGKVEQGPKWVGPVLCDPNLNPDQVRRMVSPFFGLAEDPAAGAATTRGGVEKGTGADGRPASLSRAMHTGPIVLFRLSNFSPVFSKFFLGPLRGSVSRSLVDPPFPSFQNIFGGHKNESTTFPAREMTDYGRCES